LKSVLEDVCNLEEKYIGGDSPVKLIVAITWPARKNCLFYRDDAKDAIESGETFAHNFDQIKSFARALCGDQLYNNHLLVHSMGNRMLESMIDHLTKMEQAQLSAFFKEIIMAAPDVDWHAFEESYALCKLTLLGERITVYHHTEDLALYLSQLTYNKNLRLGRHGFRDIEKVPQNVYGVDCSNVDEETLIYKIIDHSYYQYSNCAIKDIVHVLKSKPTDEFINDSLRLSKGSRQYQIQYVSTDTL
jgi:esterase/lipase superfamily enzyme